MTPWYGFETWSGAVVQVEAATIHEAMDQAEAETGSHVLRGRCLDGFDNNAQEGRAELVRPW